MKRPHLRSWLRLARATPEQVQDLTHAAADQRELLLRDLHLTSSNDSHLNALAHEVDKLLPTIEGLELDGRLSDLLGRVQTVTRHIDATAKEAASARLLATLGPPASLEDGLSVLIPSWNHGTRIDRAIASARGLVPAGRIVVLDDASTDATPTVLARHPDIRVIRADENLGLTRARNALLHVVGTTRAIFLDADNEIDATAMQVLDGLAVEWAATVTHGALVEVDEHDRARGLLSSGPLDGGFFSNRHNTVDTLSILDVAAVRGVGGYTLDPALETSEDWDMWHRLAHQGGLLLYVPCVAGRKLRADRGHNSQPQDHNQQFRLIDRTYRFDDQLDDTAVASAVVHPATGPLWASDAAVRIRPLLAPALPERLGAGRIPAAAAVHPAPRSVLVVGSGGVRNLGDDATTSTTIRRLRAVLDPSVGIEVITDGPRPSGDYEPGVWLGTVREFANRPLDHHAAVLISGGGTLSQEFPEAGASRQAVAAEAARGGVPVLLSGQGIGPFDRDPSEIRALLAQAAAVAVRDPLSARVAAGLGATNVTVTGDDATEPGDPPARPDALRLVGDAGWLAFNGRLAGYSAASVDQLAAWARAVDQAAGHRGLEVVAVAQNRQPPWEIETLSALAEQSRHAAWHVLDATDDLPLARAAYGLAAGVVARSFHAAWFGLTAGVPTLLPATGGYYRAKADGLAELAGLPPEFADDTPPADGDEVDRRLAAVEAIVACRPLDGIDAAITAWLVAQLGALGVPLAAGYGANPSASTSPSTTAT